MLFKKIYYFLGCGLLVLGNSFVPPGKWVIQNREFPYFMVEKKNDILTISNNSVIRMSTKNWFCEDDTYTFELDNLRLIKKPNDWYNIKKYFRYITIYNKIRSDGLKIILRISLDEAEVMYRFEDEDYIFVLKKIE